MGPLALLSVHTVSLGRPLGLERRTRWDPARRRPVSEPRGGPERLRLTDLPARLRASGIEACEVSHAHLPAVEELTPRYLDELRAAFAAAPLTFWSLLVDYGDLASADAVRAQADRAYAAEWIRAAAAAGARYVRVALGDGDPEDAPTVERAVRALDELCRLAEALGVGLLIENSGRLCAHAATCLAICDRLEGRVGLTADFGNFDPAERQQGLAALLPRARSVHAKPDCDAHGRIDAAGFTACLDLAAEAGFSGAYTIVYRGPGDPWDGVARTAALIRQHPRALGR